MHDQARRLVEYGQCCVFVDGVERHRLGGKRELIGQWCRRDDDGLAARHFLAHLGGLAVERDAAVFDPRLQPATGVFGKTLRERLVQSLPGQRLG